jgi:four helix bundle protein
MRSFNRLVIWQQSHQLVLKVYQVTAHFPSAEIFGLTSQMRRASISIPSNIAEGCGRKSAADFARFLQVAHGSCTELEYQILLSKELGYLNEPEFIDLHTRITTIGKMLYNFLSRLTSSSTPPRQQPTADS